MTHKYTALIVEDESAIANLLKVNLNTLEVNATIFGDGFEAKQHLQTVSKPYDFIILDRMLPALDGIEICKFIRANANLKTTPILMITALTKPEDVVDGLEAGADDYITKPFDINVFKARVKTILRRIVPTETPKNVIVHQDIKVDLDQCKVWVLDEEVLLTVSEYKLLCVLLERPGKVLTRKNLVEAIQGGQIHVTERIIDTHVFGLRKKLGESANFIETIRGIGYRILTN